MYLLFKMIKSVKFLFKSENIIPYIIIFIIFFLDRFSKIKILNSFSDTPVYINNFINLDLIWNTGIGFGLLSLNSPLYYNIISLIIGAVVIMLLYTLLKLQKFEKICFSIIIGGALGNFYDRIFFKAVPDFIDMHYGNFHWFTFNVADVFISIGIAGFLMKNFFVKKIDEKI